MADDPNVIEEEEVVTDPQEETEETEIETETEESEEPKLEEAETEESEEGEEETEQEVFLEDADYLQQKGFYAQGLPSHIKTIDEAMSYGLSMANQAQRAVTDSQKLAKVNEILAQQGVSGGVDAFIASGGINQPLQQQTFGAQPNMQTQKVLPDRPYGDIVDNMIKRGEIKTEDQPFFRRLGDSVDHALSSVSQPLLQGVAVTANEVLAMKKKVRDMEWRMLSKKVRETAPRHELDALINSGKAEDYDEASFEWARYNNRPDLMNLMWSKKSTPAANQPIGRPRTLGGRKPRKREPIKRKPTFAEFLNPDGTVNEKLIEQRYPGNYDKQVEILEKIQKEATAKT